MWIRKQNKKALININMVFVKGKTIYANSENNILGFYDSEERAMEILDNIYYTLFDAVIDNGNQLIVVFDMPEK